MVTLKFLSQLIRNSKVFKSRSIPNQSFSRYVSNKKTYEKMPLCFGTVLGVYIGYKIFDNNYKSTEKSHLCAVVLPPDDQGKSVRVKFNFVADVAEKIIPSVVEIQTKASHALYFRYIPTSRGSGFIVKSDGLILTNAHVVENYGAVTIKLHDGRQFEGVVENCDHNNDLATVRINATDLPVLPLGVSSKLRVGEFVIAMGSPLSLSHSITMGVVSSVNRHSKELGLDNRSDFIQTDAAINIGNSGGPLVNLDGEAIGINTMKVGEGISFAIPSDYAAEFLKRCEEKQKKGFFSKSKTETKPPLQRRYIGVTMLSLTPRIIQELQLRNPDFPDVDQGVLVWRVVQGSPAHQAGMKAGDVILTINKSNIASASDVYEFLSRGKVLDVVFMRGSQSYSTSIYPLAPPA